MPIYEYTCGCGSKVERYMAMGADAPNCPQCGGVMLYKFSPIAMIKMKGMGGYPSLRKAYQAGGRDLVGDYKKTKKWV